MLSLFNRRKRFKDPKVLLTDPTGFPGDHFGRAVALSDDKITLLVGAELGDAGVSPFNTGNASVYIRNETTWTQQAVLTRSSSTAGDEFGTSVALSSDGDTAIVGAPFSDVGWQNAGSAVVFTRSGGTWTQQAILTDSAGAESTWLGYSVALSSDGDTAIVGAPGDNQFLAGKTLVFTRSGGTWTQQATLTYSLGVSRDLFGISVAVSGDGDMAIIGMPQYDKPGGLSNAGSAVVFTRSGGTWTEQAVLAHSAGVLNDRLGWSVALSRDGELAVCGAPYRGLNGRGAVILFTRSGGTWTEGSVLTHDPYTANDYLGWSISVSNNKNRIICGAPSFPGSTTSAGSAVVFKLTNGVWQQESVLTSSNPVFADAFGYSVASSADGNIIVIGAYQDSVGVSSDQGSVTIFYRR
jgi:hypothetical protein